MEDILKNKLMTSGWKKYSLSEKFVVFCCGHDAGQAFFGLFSTSQKIYNSFMDNLSDLMISTSQVTEQIENLKRFKDLANIDDVTGLFNQRKLLKDLNSAIVRYKKLGEIFSVFFIDIDYFKK